MAEPKRRGKVCIKIVEVTIPLSQRHQPRVQDMSFETIVTFKSLPRICRDTKSKEWCTKRNPCGTNRWRAQQQCMATCGICTDGEPGKSGFFIMLPFVQLTK